MKQISIVWFKQDLRLMDNPALHAARHDEILPVFIWDNKTSPRKAGGASRWWLHHSLHKLNESLDHNLNIYQGNAVDIIVFLAQKFRVQMVRWNRSYELEQMKAEKDLSRKLAALGVMSESFNGNFLFEPSHMLKTDGTPYRVFTPFYKKAIGQSHEVREVLLPPKRLTLKKDPSNPLSIDSLGLLPKISWDKSLEKFWTIGEKAAQKKLRFFLQKKLLGYCADRDFPGHDHTSRLSPHVSFGEISAAQIFHETNAYAEIHGLNKDAQKFLSELLWREFSHYLLYFFPKLDQKNYNAKFNAFYWHKNQTALKAWQQGQTGIPLVDAGMRELAATGFMHNRVRMVVASFLVKNLRIDWRKGAQWFLDYLVDADLANNSTNWQWVAGCGVDAAPYFRIFNPTTQGQKFDAEGNYTLLWLPELKSLPRRFLFCPWTASEEVLQKAGITLGKTYPYPIVDLALSRTEALQAYRALP